MWFEQVTVARPVVPEKAQTVDERRVFPWEVRNFQSFEVIETGHRMSNDLLLSVRFYVIMRIASAAAECETELACHVVESSPGAEWLSFSLET